MGVTDIYRVEVGVFFAALSLLMGYRMAAGKISLAGLLCREGMEKISPERVLLLLATLIVAMVYAVNMLMGDVEALPVLRTRWLVLFGMSCLIYVGMKAFRTFVGRKS